MSLGLRLLLVLDCVSLNVLGVCSYRWKTHVEIDILIGVVKERLLLDNLLVRLLINLLSLS